MDMKEVFKDHSKACQDTNVPTKIFKEIADIFTDYSSFNKCCYQ